MDYNERLTKVRDAERACQISEIPDSSWASVTISSNGTLALIAKDGYLQTFKMTEQQARDLLPILAELFPLDAVDATLGKER